MVLHIRTTGHFTPQKLLYIYIQQTHKQCIRKGFNHLTAELEVNHTGTSNRKTMYKWISCYDMTYKKKMYTVYFIY